MLKQANIMKTLSIRQPWAHLIVHGTATFARDSIGSHLGRWSHGKYSRYKDIENRPWEPYKGIIGSRVLIHAGKKLDKTEHERAFNLVRDHFPGHIKPPEYYMSFGAIIGSVEIIDCVTESDSPWFTGPFGWVLANPVPCDPVPYKGQLGLFNVEWPVQQ